MLYFSIYFYIFSIFFYIFLYFTIFFSIFSDANPCMNVAFCGVGVYVASPAKYIEFGQTDEH